MINRRRWIRSLVSSMSAFALAAPALVGVSNAQVNHESRLRLAAAPEDFAALGIGETIEVREDGRRTPRSEAHFEWWYFDAHLDDGTVVVIWFGDNWFYGYHTRAVDIEITSPGGESHEAHRIFTDPGTFATDRANIQIGPHRFESDLDTYTIYVDPAETGGFGGNLTLRRRAPSYRSGTGHIFAGENFFAWLVAVPEGEVSGTLTLDGVSRQVSGSGYHDHNWGNVSPRELFDGWWWGRARIGDHIVIAAELHGKQGVGGGNIPLFFVGTESHVAINAFGSDVNTVEGPPTRHPDPHHRRAIGSSISFATADGVRAEFAMSDRLLTSANLLDRASTLERVGAFFLGIHPWYTRVASPVTLSLPGQPPQRNDGTLEYFEFK